MNELIRKFLDSAAPALNALIDLSAAQLIGVMFCVLGVTLLGCLLWNSRPQRDHKPGPVLEELLALKDAAIATLEQQLAKQHTALDTLGERVLALEGYVEMVGSKQQRAEAEKRNADFYQHLVRLANRGMSAAELSRRFGISASEAALITAMHKKAG